MSGEHLDNDVDNDDDNDDEDKGIKICTESKYFSRVSNEGKF